MDHYIGLDLGTSSVKAILTTDTGEILDQVSCSYETYCDSHGLSEINPEIWYENVVKCLQYLTAKIKDIKAIGVTGQMHSLTLVGPNGEAIRPVMMWNDLRTQSQVEKLKKVASENDLDYISGIVSTGSPAANLLYVKENEPEVFNKINKILIGHDYIVYRLTGHAGADYCEASTSSLYDIETQSWADSVINYIGIKQSTLPEIMPSCCEAGKLNENICNELGLVSRPSVTEGTGDNAANSIVINEPCISLGTSGVYTENRKALLKDKKGKNILLSLKGENPLIVVQGVVQSVGSTLDWLQYIIGAESVGTMLEDLPEKVSEDLMFYPHLNGDKTLYHDSTLRGAFFGLSISTKKNELVTAAVEGIGFAIRQMMEQVSSSDGHHMITVAGGLTRSSKFMQILSNILECDLKTLEKNPSAVYGAVLMAMRMENNIAKNTIKTGKIYYPQKDKASYYSEKYKRYLKINKCLP